MGAASSRMQVVPGAGDEVGVVGQENGNAKEAWGAVNMGGYLHGARITLQMTAKGGPLGYSTALILVRLSSVTLSGVMGFLYGQRILGRPTGIIATERQ